MLDNANTSTTVQALKAPNLKAKDQTSGCPPANADKLPAKHIEHRYEVKEEKSRQRED